MTFDFDSLFFLSRLYISFGDDRERVTPVPIPNTAVKPLIADGTTSSRGGRVGRLQIHLIKSQYPLRCWLFCVYAPKYSMTNYSLK